MFTVIGPTGVLFSSGPQYRLSVFHLNPKECVRTAVRPATSSSLQSLPLPIWRSLPQFLKLNVSELENVFAGFENEIDLPETVRDPSNDARLIVPHVQGNWISKFKPLESTKIHFTVNVVASIENELGFRLP